MCWYACRTELVKSNYQALITNYDLVIAGLKLYITHTKKCDNLPIFGGKVLVICFRLGGGHQHG